METFELFVLAGASVALCVCTWGVCHWWYGRKLRAAADQLERSDKARQFSSQQTIQARKQIEKLQKDLAERQRALAQFQGNQQRTLELDAMLRQNERAAPQAHARVQLPVDGFADTQPM